MFENCDVTLVISITTLVISISSILVSIIIFKKSYNTEFRPYLSYTGSRLESLNDGKLTIALYLLNVGHVPLRYCIHSSNIHLNDGKIISADNLEIVQYIGVNEGNGVHERYYALTFDFKGYGIQNLISYDFDIRYDYVGKKEKESSADYKYEYRKTVTKNLMNGSENFSNEYMN